MQICSDSMKLLSAVKICGRYVSLFFHKFSQQITPCICTVPYSRIVVSNCCVVCLCRVVLLSITGIFCSAWLDVKTTVQTLTLYQQKHSSLVTTTSVCWMQRSVELWLSWRMRQVAFNLVINCVCRTQLRFRLAKEHSRCSAASYYISDKNSFPTSSLRQNLLLMLSKLTTYDI